jgi:hypothetical protein
VHNCASESEAAIGKPILKNWLRTWLTVTEPKKSFEIDVQQKGNSSV